MNKTLMTWGPVAGLIVVAEAIYWLLAAQGSPTVALAVRGVGWAAAVVWFVTLLFSLAQPRYFLWTGLYFGTLLAGAAIGWALEFVAGPAGGVFAFCLGLAASIALTSKAYATRPQWRSKAMAAVLAITAFALTVVLLRAEFYAVAISVAGGSVLLLGFFLGLIAIRGILMPTHPVLAVARAVVEEAVKMRIGLVFVLLLVVALPLLPILLVGQDRVSFRVQSFLNWSLSGTGFLLSIMTLFLACATICFEQERKWIHVTLVKPVARWKYLLGKWLGIAMLNALLLLLAGSAIYVTARAMERTPAKDRDDREMLETQVLTARASVPATHPDQEAFQAQIQQTIEQMIADEPERYPDGMPMRGQRRVAQQAIQAWHTLAPDHSQTYRFANLEEAVSLGRDLQLRLRPKSHNTFLHEVPIRFKLWLNDRPWPMVEGEHVEQELNARVYKVFTIPIDAVEENRLDVRIENVSVREQGENEAAIAVFDTDGGMEVLYRVGAFEGNLARSVTLMFVRLSFIAVVGIAAGTFLSFHVASLLTLIVLLAGIGSNWLEYATSLYTGYDGQVHTLDKEVWLRMKFFWMALSQLDIMQAATVFFSVIAEVLMALVPSLSRLNPVPLLSTGRLVSYSLVAEGIVVVGVLWSLVLGLIGVWLFERRELARITV